MTLEEKRKFTYSVEETAYLQQTEMGYCLHRSDDSLLKMRPI
jgi:hypothetical protein